MKRSRSGFSLVELMVVVALIGIMGLLGAPSLLTMVGNYRVNGATKALEGKMHLVRAKAVAKDQTHHVAFDDSAQTLTVYSDADNDWTTANDTDETLSLATAFPGVSLGYNACNGPDNTAIAASAVFGSTATPVRAVFLPNGLLQDPGYFYLIPTVDLGVKNDRMRALQVTRTGEVTRYRYKAGATPPWEVY